MNKSRVYVNKLQRRQTEAWTELLRVMPELSLASVVDIQAKSIADHPNLTRYLLTIEGQREPIPFIGKRTNGAEARFYAEISVLFSNLAAPCWLSHSAGDQSWVILADVPQHRPGERWTAKDAEAIISALSHVHASFWNEADYLNQQNWLTNSLYLPPKAERKRGYYGLVKRSSRYVGLGRASTLSAHALHTSGRLAPVFVRAAAGLDILRHLGGWPGIIDAVHMEAMAELLDDPLPMLQPLRELPLTLLHGDPAPHHWHVTLFDERYLLDWSQVTYGPAICDVVSFLEQLKQVWTRTHGETWPVTEETMLDNYMLRMSMKLGTGFPGRQMRQAIPAGLCLYLLTNWLPNFADWLSPFISHPQTWQNVVRMDNRHLGEVGLEQLVGLEGYLTNLFMQFRQAYKML